MTDSIFVSFLTETETETEKEIDKIERDKKFYEKRRKTVNFLT